MSAGISKLDESPGRPVAFRLAILFVAFCVLLMHPAAQADGKKSSSVGNPPAVKVSITTVSQAELLKRHRLSLRLRARVPVHARVRILSGGRTDRFVSRRIRLREGRARSLTIRITRRGLDRLATCGNKKVVAVVSFHGGVRIRGGERSQGKASGKVTARRVLTKDPKRCHGPTTISSDPPLFPRFSPAISDYVTRCAASPGAPVRLEVRAGAGNAIAIDGRGPRRGRFTAKVDLDAGEEFSFTRTTGSGSTRHHVRCLPADFPTWAFKSPGQPRQQWYLITAGRYAIIFDRHGVPVWWFKGDDTIIDLKYLEDGTLAWNVGEPVRDPRYEIRSLDGTLLNTLRAVGHETDRHDIQLLPNGNYMLIAAKRRSTPTDLTSFGGPADATILDAELQEVTPAGTLVWSWDSKDHIGLAETGHWWDDYVLGNTDSYGGAYDYVHINSIDVSPRSIVLSMRNTDGIYKIDRASGNIEWKLGGTPTPESLTVIGDAFGSHPLGGQHDARILADGTLTAHENGFPQNRRPRVVRYAIDEETRTATLLESFSDPEVPEALCCGSARRADDGSWLTSWGGVGETPHPVAEYNRAGQRIFSLEFTQPGVFSYRAVPIAPGILGDRELRAGMNSQYPRPAG